MIDCLIIGDSIAVGTHQYRSECVAYAKIGLNSRQWNRLYLQNDLNAKSVVISLGSNDYFGISTQAELQKIRAKVGNDSKVFWIMPAFKPDIQEIVKQVAKEYGDTVVPISRLSKDGVHPTGTGYKELADRTK